MLVALTVRPRILQAPWGKAQTRSQAMAHTMTQTVTRIGTGASAPAVTRQTAVPATPACSLAASDLKKTFPDAPC
ncbi:hypothetical protein BJY04DRAFT_200181 [Aspergillus karnatakaensis]|uniref:uncharacterized protein n=1 Tax=Aspergillus karnatakaensis TaxID=1810916 RepID=UPI003CCD56DC